jgi:nitrogen fixation protein FixH
MKGARLAMERPRGSWIPWLFFAFFVTMVSANGIMIWIAVRSWTGTATDQAYEKGLAYNRNLEAARLQAALGWSSRLEARVVAGFTAEALLTLSDVTGAPIEDAEVEARFERPTQIGADFTVGLAHEGQGRYRADFALPLVGQWNVHVIARRGGALFVHDERMVLR